MNRYMMAERCKDSEADYLYFAEKEFNDVDEAVDYFNESFTNDGSCIVVKVVAETHNELLKIAGSDE